ncbi:glycosyltransferase [Thermodesulfitimonas sp.]
MALPRELPVAEKVSDILSATETLEAYAAFAGEELIADLLRLGEELRGVRFQQVNSTRLGGGVAEMLRSLIPLERALGLDVSWEVLTGEPAFFNFTKQLHNFLQGRPGTIDILGVKAYWETNRANYRLVDEHADVVLIHDPQPAGLITFVPPEVRRRQKWFWRCHIQIDKERCVMVDFLKPLVELYDAAIFSVMSYIPNWQVRSFIILPYINPLSEKNRELSETEIRQVLDKYGIADPARKPLILLVSRFDLFKGHRYALEAFKEVRRQKECQLLFVGGTASDDPENERIFAALAEEVKKVPDAYLLNLPPDSHREINALQRAATVILQPSTKEGFGLTVTEGMWKEKPVVATNVGGIPTQIADGYNGFLVAPGEAGVREMAARILYLLEHPLQAQVMGRRARETVRERFLITRGLWDELMLVRNLLR